MNNRNTYQVHASANNDGHDLALRLSITHYDDGGFEIGHKTWRRHVRSLDFDSSEWTAYSVAVELSKMMANHAQGALDPDELDVPLF